MSVTATASSPKDLLLAIERRPPTVAIIDVRSGGDWISAVPPMKSVSPDLAVIAVTGHNGTMLHSEILRVGCSGVLSLRATETDFRQAVYGAMRGYGFVETAILTEVFAGPKKQTEQITMPERDVIRCLADGLSNRQIAERMNYSVGTVKSYVHNIFEKLQVSNRIQATVTALRMGIID
jgi:DNA-binding NarL/FixJ family response regulator